MNLGNKQLNKKMNNKSMSQASIHDFMKSPVASKPVLVQESSHNKFVNFNIGSIKALN